MFKKVLNPPIRWAGSKKKLLNEMLEKMFRKDKKVYVECFLGSGVVLLNILNNKEEFSFNEFYVNDINSNVISFFVLLKSDVKYLIDQLSHLEKDYNGKELTAKEQLYYEIRDKFNVMKENDKMKPIYFYFLMTTGFNGVYRENRNGNFNVPFGKKEKINIPNEKLTEISAMIQPVEFYNMDYKDFINTMKKKGKTEEAFIYCDPPYIPDDIQINQKQELYTKNIFDHREFIEYIDSVDIKNMMISMADSTKASDIFEGHNFIKKDVNKIIRSINPQKRLISKEIAYINYEIDEN